MGPGCDARSPPLRRWWTGAGLSAGCVSEEGRTGTLSPPLCPEEQRLQRLQARSSLLPVPIRAAFFFSYHTHTHTHPTHPHPKRLARATKTHQDHLEADLDFVSRPRVSDRGNKKKSKRRNVGELEACDEPLLTDSIINNHKRAVSPPSSRPFSPGRHDNSSDLSQSHPLRTNLLLPVSSFLISAS